MTPNSTPALRAASFLDRYLRDSAGGLLRTVKDGIARYPAYLDDHAFLAAARLDLFEATGDPAHLERTRELSEVLISDFLDPDQGGFFFTAVGHEKLIDRPKIAFDSSIPAGNAVAAETFLRLAHLLGEERYREIGERTLSLFGEILQNQPFGVGYLVGVLDDHLRGPRDVVIVGTRDKPQTRELARAGGCDECTCTDGAWVCEGVKKPQVDRGHNVMEVADARRLRGRQCRCRARDCPDQ